METKNRIQWTNTEQAVVYTAWCKLGKGPSTYGTLERMRIAQSCLPVQRRLTAKSTHYKWAGEFEFNEFTKVKPLSAAKFEEIVAELNAAPTEMVEIPAPVVPAPEIPVESTVDLDVPNVDLHVKVYVLTEQVRHLTALVHNLVHRLDTVGGPNARYANVEIKNELANVGKVEPLMRILVIGLMGAQEQEITRRLKGMVEFSFLSVQTGSVTRSRLENRRHVNRVVLMSRFIDHATQATVEAVFPSNKIHVASGSVSGLVRLVYSLAAEKAAS